MAVLAAFGLTAWIGEVAGSELERPDPVDLDDHVAGSHRQRGRRGHLRPKPSTLTTPNASA
jgi:hypothetical protein